ncbi:MAG: type II secretion system F family protein [Halodesulfurarchaeum sp.]|nr:type II secretion system F family protein [Halodesulfurarchaeum sp.]
MLETRSVSAGIQWLRDELSLSVLSPRLAAWLAQFRRRRAVGAGPDLLAFAILQLTLTPSLERAADFAIHAVDGRLSRSLRAHRLATVSGERAVRDFAAEWAPFDRSLKRSVTLMGVAMDAPKDRQRETLEAALEAVLEGARERVVEFSAAIRGPAMGIYAFGVMLPLALVGLLPVLASSGGGVSTLALGIVYDLLIPVGLAGSGLWLWGRRPAVTDTAFDVGLLEHARSPAYALSTGAGAAAFGGMAAHFFAPAWVIPIVAVGIGLGTVLLVGLQPVLEEVERLDRLEARLPDALSIVGQRLGEGEPVETAIGSVAERFDGPLGDLFGRATTRQARSGEPMATVFLAENGLLTDVPRQRVRAGLSLAMTAGEYGAPGGETLHAVGEYLGELLDVERAARRELAQTTSTLRQTAVVFAPAIAGVTVALATGMGAVDGTDQALDVAALGQVIGIYVLLLGAVLPSLSVVLERGFDPVRMGYQSGIALAVGAVVYPLSFIAARTLVYV